MMLMAENHNGDGDDDDVAKEYYDDPREANRVRQSGKKQRKHITTAPWPGPRRYTPSEKDKAPLRMKSFRLRKAAKKLRMQATRPAPLALADGPAPAAPSRKRCGRTLSSGERATGYCAGCETGALYTRLARV